MHASLTGGLMLLDRDFSRWILERSGRKSLARTMLSASAPSFESARGYASINPRALESRFANNFWVDVGYARQIVDGDGNAGRYTLNGPEVSLGYDHIAPSGWLGGLAFRYGDRDMKVNSRLSEADIDSYSLAAYGGFQAAFGPGAARLMLGGVYTRHNIDGRRSVDIGAVRQRLESGYRANSRQLFMEGAYAMPVGVVWLEPFVDLAWTSMRVPGFMEKGGAAALRTQSHSQNNLSQLLGLRLVSPTICRVNVEAQAGWRHTYGKLDKAHSFGFAEGGGRFGVRGGKLNRNEAVLDLRADHELRENLRLGLEANAAVGGRGTSLRGGIFVALEW
jgi:outer membrane autotransporter protein